MHVPWESDYSQNIKSCFLPCTSQYEEAAFCAPVPSMLRWFFCEELLRDEARPPSLCLEQLQWRINLLQLGQFLSLVPCYLHVPARLTRMPLPLRCEETAAQVLVTEAGGIVVTDQALHAAARPGQPSPLFVSGAQTALSLKPPAPASQSLQKSCAGADYQLNPGQSLSSLTHEKQSTWMLLTL